MLAGIVVQLVVMLAFVTFGVVWAHRAAGELRACGRALWTLLFGMAVASICIIIRGAYRTGELSEGFFGPLAVRRPP